MERARPRLPWAEIGLTIAGIAFLAAIVLLVPELRRAFEAAVQGDTDEGGTLVMPYSETATLKLAYAISVHKAQGCEVPVVVAICHRSHQRMLSRPLVYTAITRARRACVVIGEQAALATAIGRDDSGARFSGLAERLRG